MKDLNLDFINDVTLEEVKPASKGATRSATPKLPETADIRVFASGRVYPSEKFAKDYGLQFMLKNADGDVQGNGLDIFNSKKWGMIAGKLPEGQELIFCAAVPRGSAKIDMWGSCTFAEDGNPKADVFTQGANTFAKAQLLDMISDIYQIEWDKTNYVDMTVAVANVIAAANGIYQIPKIVSGGQHKGEDTYVRRENLTICPLVVDYVDLKDVKQADVFDAEPVVEQGAPFDEELPPNDGEKFSGASGIEGTKDETPVSPEEAFAANELVEEANPETPSSPVDPGEDWANNMGQ